MTYPDFSSGLQVVGVFDAGVPNAERIVLRPSRAISLAGRAVAVGVGNPSGGAYPLYDHVFWFPELIVEPPAWLFVYTGKGVQRHTQLPGGDPAITFHWNRAETVFHHPDLVAMAFGASETEIGQQWPKPQLPASGTP